MSLQDDGTVSQRISQSYKYLIERLRFDLLSDPFKQLGRWTEFLTHRLYFAVFVHPDASTAYQVYEVINTRGRELTTADLLKNFVLSQTAPAQRQARYEQWQNIARQFALEGSSNFVQYIRHVVTVRCGHILPKDLFGFLAGRQQQSGKQPPSPDQLMLELEEHLPLYLQMIDPTSAGPADPDALRIFAALNSLSVIAVRPILLAIAGTPNAVAGMEYLLKLVVRRVVVGNLGTGNVERRFGEAARKVQQNGAWGLLVDEFADLNPTKEEFIDQLRKRSFNKGALAFFRRSVLSRSIAPNQDGVLHFIWPRQGTTWADMGEEEAAFWAATLGNTFLSNLERRPRGANDWDGFKELLLSTGIDGEWVQELSEVTTWNAESIEEMGHRLAQVAGEVWYP